MNQILVTNIQEFSLSDGPGIRTTVFFKGCAIHCPWCANPENIKSSIEWSFDEKKCICDGGICILDSECNRIKAKKRAGEDTNTNNSFICYADALTKVGIYYTQEELLEGILRDIDFWRGSGGVTFSGGEPFLQLQLCEELLRKLKEKGIEIIVETSLFALKSAIEKILAYIDFLYVDFKILNGDKCKKILGGDIDQFIDNFSLIQNNGKKYIARMPIVDGLTNEIENIERFINLIIEYKPQKVEIFSVHNLGAEKYRKMGKKYYSFPKTDIEVLRKLQKYIEEKGQVDVEVLEI